MTYANKVTLNFAGGEVDPGIYTRSDLPLAQRVLARMQNFIAEPQGYARYRSGTRQVHHTRNNNYAAFIEFQFSDVQSYLIEATEGYFRFYKDEGIIFEDAAELTITGVSKADPGVVTYTGTDPANGQEVYISEVVGMTELNGKFYTVANVNSGANTFELTDVNGDDVDTTSFTTYSSGGIAQVVYEIKTPYLAEHLPYLGYDQNADTMYIVHNYYEPRKLTRSAHDNWTLTRYTRTNDQFAVDNSTYGTITAINTGTDVISDAGHTFVDGDHVYITEVVGTTEINDRHFTIHNSAAGTYQIKDYDTGVVENMTNAYVSGGIVEKLNAGKYPGAVGFTDDARLGFAGSTDNPETQWYSRSPSAAGAVRFDDFTTGTDATHALFFTLAPLRGKVDSIRWMTNTDKYIALGTFGSVRRVFGATESAAIAPDEITAKGANSDGVYPARPVSDGSVLYYINRSGLSLEAIEYDYQVDGYNPDDKSLVASRIAYPGLRQIVRQVGRPNVIWARRSDGLLLGLTAKAKENISGWHRHPLGGDAAEVESLGVMPRENNADQLWLIVKRTINGQVVRYVEFMTDPPVYPDIDDFYTAADADDADEVRFFKAQWERAKQAIHLDCSATYDGSAYGTAAGAGITLGAGADTEDTEDVTVTASAAVFTSSMVGREVWGKYDTAGLGGGRIEITDYVSSTVVRGTIVDAFSVTSFGAGEWYLTATELSGLDHLEGEEVHVIADGGAPESVTVSGGVVILDLPTSVAHVGFNYRGMLITLPLEQGGVTGPAMNKTKIVIKTAIRFINSAGCEFGTNMYDLIPIEFRQGNTLTDLAVPLYNGVDESTYEDQYDTDKRLIVVQNNSLPCIVSALDVFTDTTDE